MVSKADTARALVARALVSTQRETREERIARLALRSCAGLFEDVGDPWITETEWTREELLAQNPNANTSARKSAQAFTQRHAVYPYRAKPKFERGPEKKPEPVPLPEKSRITKEVLNYRGSRQRMREAAERERAALAQRNSIVLTDSQVAAIAEDQNKPEVWAEAKPMTGNGSSIEAHWRTMLREWTSAHHYAESVGNTQRAAKCQARIDAISKQLSKVSTS